MTTKKVQLYLDRDKTIEASPETSANCVILSDGNDLQKVLDNDLTNPTVVHEETSFKVGVGDIDVSSSVVDGEVGRMVIKGKTYQNILPEPSTHVLTNNKEMFKVNEGLDTNVEIVDAVSKSAILKGQTLVNVLVDYPQQTYVLDGRWQQKNLSSKNTENIKPNTEYTFVFHVSECNMSVDGNVNLQIGDDTFFNNPKNIKLYKGLNTFKLKTVDSELKPPMRLFTHPNSVGTLSFTLMLLEGDYTNVDIPYFEGMQSVKMPVLTTIGKNLFNSSLYPEQSNSWTDFVPINRNLGEQIISYQNRSKTPYIRFFDSNKVSLGIDETFGYKRAIPTEAHYFKIQHIGSLEDIQVEEGSVATSYEPYKSNILTVNEPIELRGIGDIKDDLNLLTGEVTERIGEVVLDGAEDWAKSSSSDTTCLYTVSVRHLNRKIGVENVFCDKFITMNTYNTNTDKESIFASNSNPTIYIRINKNKLSSEDLTGFKQYLQSNPITVQYELAQESVKTVDLSSSGNWEKIVLDGSENWGVYQRNNSVNFTNTSSFQAEIPNANFSTDSLALFTNSHFKPYSFYSSDREGAFIKVNKIRLAINKNKLVTDNVEGFKQYMRQNPVTVWYQTDASLDSTQVKQPIFFKDGHIIQSSGADNSLIPTLDYQVKTSNSYVMDLMKPNTQYTMKAKTANGTFTIDGVSYGAGTNGTFTTPSSMTNKLLVMSNKTNEEVMILEGDVVSKTIPYFKGIKSAFENESKIEVLSTGKNLYPYGDSTYIPEHNGWYFVNGDRQTRWGEKVHKDCGQGAWFYLDGGRYYFSVVNNNNVRTLQVIGDKEQLYGDGNLIPSGWYTLRMSVKNANEEVNITNIMVEKDTKTTYEPYKSNNTKIPLLSSLRSLPNGVCDELIIDRENNKAKIIQRVGVEVLDGSAHEAWGLTANDDSGVRFPNDVNNMYAFPKTNGNPDGKVFTNSLLPCVFTTKTANVPYKQAFSAWSNKIVLYLDSSITNVSQLRNYLSQNPVTVQYELETPIVAELDLSGFPYIYKDGHIFLNGGIAPVVEIDYNVNQAQQIQANNETLQRHELDILDLDNLIVSFVNAEYKLRLLKFNMELSMMALAE